MSKRCINDNEGDLAMVLSDSAGVTLECTKDHGMRRERTVRLTFMPRDARLLAICLLEAASEAEEE